MFKHTIAVCINYKVHSKNVNYATFLQYHPTGFKRHKEILVSYVSIFLNGNTHIMICKNSLLVYQAPRVTLEKNVNFLRQYVSCRAQIAKENKIGVIYYADNRSRFLVLGLEIHRSQDPGARSRGEILKTPAGNRDAGGARGADAREIETYPLFEK